MLLFSRQRPSAGWPFWLLIAAWLCANTPSIAVFELVNWLGNARHFSHQQRLQAEVAQVLLGEKGAPRQLVATTTAAAKPCLPVVPTDLVLKKIELAMERTSELLPPTLRASQRGPDEPRVPEIFRAPPPHEPPRWRLVA